MIANAALLAALSVFLFLRHTKQFSFTSTRP
jgi:hypothetical protein